MLDPSIFTDETPLTNAERFTLWLDKWGPMKNFEERWPGVPYDVARAIDFGEYVPLPDLLRKQAE